MYLARVHLAWGYLRSGPTSIRIANIDDNQQDYEAAGQNFKLEDILEKLNNGH
jgi:hypothetical protein